MSARGSRGEGRRVAVVTSGSRGIGRSVVQHLAKDGLDVVVVYASDEAEALSAVAEVKAQGANAIAAAVDVADEEAVARVFDETERTFGRVDVVINAAGLMTLAPLVDFDLAALDRMHRTNIRGTFVVDQQAARRVRPGGAIINFSSSVLGRVLPTYTAYAASKAAVDAMTFILAHELRGRDVTVNAVAPGPTATFALSGPTDGLLVYKLAGYAQGTLAPDLSKLQAGAGWVLDAGALARELEASRDDAAVPVIALDDRRGLRCIRCSA